MKIVSRIKLPIETEMELFEKLLNELQDYIAPMQVNGNVSKTPHLLLSVNQFSAPSEIAGLLTEQNATVSLRNSSTNSKCVPGFIG